MEDILKNIEKQKKALKNNPEDYSAVFALALSYAKLGENNKAIENLLPLISKKPEQVEPYILGSSLNIEMGDFATASRIADEGLEKFPDNEALISSKLTCELQSGEVPQNFKYLDSLNPQSLKKTKSPHALFKLGHAYYNAGMHKEAVECYKLCLEKDAKHYDAMNNIGNIYIEQKLFVDGADIFIKLVRDNPTNTNYIIGLSVCFSAINKVDIALDLLNEALKSDSEHPLLLCTKASIMCTNGLSQEAIELYRRGLALMRQAKGTKNKEYIFHLSNFVFYMHYSPVMSREEIFTEIKNWSAEICRGIVEQPAISFDNIPDKAKKLKIGMISSGFRTHPVGQMIVRAIENLDTDNFELIAYMDHVEEEDDYITQKFDEVCSKTYRITQVPYTQLLQLIRDDHLDILLEMTGHAEGGKRLQLIAERLAPVQTKWVGGLFNSTGIPQMDWLIGDSVETPEGDDKWYTEKIYRMPDDYIVYNPPYYSPDVQELPAKRNGHITFGNLNNPAKTNKYSIEIWAKILNSVPESRILFKGNKLDEKAIREHLLNSFEAHGITRDRIIIEGGEKHKTFLDVYNRIDIALDPHPYTGGLTTCEALWMGVPVVTLPGETFAGRHAATHLTNADMAEFIAKDEQDYIDIAVKWANDLDALAELRSGLRDHVSKTPLVDGPRFAKNLEKAMRHMWGEWCDMKEDVNKPKKVSRPKPKKSKKKK